MRFFHSLLFVSLGAISNLRAAEPAPAAERPLLKPMSLALVRSARYGRTPDARDTKWSLTATWRLSIDRGGLFGWNHLEIDEARTDAGEPLTLSPTQTRWGYGDRLDRALPEVKVEVLFERPLRDFKSVIVRGSLEAVEEASTRICDVSPVSSALGKWLQFADAPGAELRISSPSEEDRKIITDQDLKMFSLTSAAQEQIVSLEVFDARNRSTGPQPPNIGSAVGSIDDHPVVGHRVPDSGRLSIRYSIPAKQARLAIDCELPLGHPEPPDPKMIHQYSAWPVVPPDAVVGAPAAPAAPALPTKSDF